MNVRNQSDHVLVSGIRRISNDAEMMFGKQLAMPVKILWAFVTPAILIVSTIVSSSVIEE